VPLRWRRPIMAAVVFYATFVALAMAALWGGTT